MPESAERVTVRTVRDDPSPDELKAYFAQLFAAMDERPRRMFVRFDLRNCGGTSFSVDLEGGEPVFRTDDGREAKACFRGRWLADHPVPLRLRKHTTVPVPLAICGPAVPEPDEVDVFSESRAREGALGFLRAGQLVRKILGLEK